MKVLGGYQAIAYKEGQSVAKNDYPQVDRSRRHLIKGQQEYVVRNGMHTWRFQFLDLYVSYFAEGYLAEVARLDQFGPSPTARLLAIQDQAIELAQETVLRDYPNVTRDRDTLEQDNFAYVARTGDATLAQPFFAQLWVMAFANAYFDQVARLDAGRPVVDTAETRRLGASDGHQGARDMYPKVERNMERFTVLIRDHFLGEATLEMTPYVASYIFAYVNAYLDEVLGLDAEQRSLTRQATFPKLWAIFSETWARLRSTV